MAAVKKYRIVHDNVGDTLTKGQLVEPKVLSDMGFDEATIAKIGLAVPVDEDGQPVQAAPQATPETNALLAAVEALNQREPVQQDNSQVQELEQRVSELEAAVKRLAENNKTPK
jgi:hypothetical protein